MPPLVKGGQSRSDDDVTPSRGGCFGMLLALVIGVAVWQLIAKVVL